MFTSAFSNRRHPLFPFFQISTRTPMVDPRSASRFFWEIETYPVKPPSLPFPAEGEGEEEEEEEEEEARTTWYWGLSVVFCPPTVKDSFNSPQAWWLTHLLGTRIRHISNSWNFENQSVKLIHHVPISIKFMNEQRNKRKKKVGVWEKKKKKNEKKREKEKRRRRKKKVNCMSNYWH